MVERSPGSRPVATRWITRRRIFPLRVLGNSDTNRTVSGANDLPSAAITQAQSSERSESPVG